MITTVYNGLQLALLVQWRVDSSMQNRASVPVAALTFLASIMILPLSYVEHKRSLRPSALLTVYLLLTTLFNAVQTRTVFLLRHTTNIPATMSAALLVGVALLAFEIQDKRRILRQAYISSSKEATSGIISWSIFWWLNSLFRTGFGKLLTWEDIDGIDEQLIGEPLGARMLAAWGKRSKPESRRTLPLTVARCFRSQFLSIIVPRLTMIAFYYAQPFLISRAISYLVEPENSESANISHGLIGATFLIYVGNAVSLILLTSTSGGIYLL